MRTIAIVPARAGSKGIARKNLMPIGGKPLVAWSIEQALDSDSISQVYVTTDCEEIAAVAREFGAQVVKRPAEISGDRARTEDAIKHLLHETKDDSETIVLLQPTSPIRQPGAIDDAIQTYRFSQADSLFSARRVEGFTWTETISKWIPHYSPYRRERRQDLDAHVEENGSIYVFAPWVLEQYESRLGGKIACYLQSPLDSFQLDGPEDIEIFEQLMPLRMGVAAKC